MTTTLELPKPGKLLRLGHQRNLVGIPGARLTISLSSGTDVQGEKPARVGVCSVQSGSKIAGSDLTAQAAAPLPFGQLADSKLLGRLRCRARVPNPKTALRQRDQKCAPAAERLQPSGPKAISNASSLAGSPSIQTSSLLAVWTRTANSALLISHTQGCITPSHPVGFCETLTSRSSSASRLAKAILVASGSRSQQPTDHSG